MTAGMWYTIQHQAVLIIFPLVLQTIITAYTTFIGWEGQSADEGRVADIRSTVWKYGNMAELSLAALAHSHD